MRTLLGQMCRTPNDCRLHACKFVHNSDSGKSQRAEAILLKALEEGIDIPERSYGEGRVHRDQIGKSQNQIATDILQVRTIRGKVCRTSLECRLPCCKFEH